jgi:hypothetical protein
VVKNRVVTRWKAPRSGGAGRALASMASIR